MGSFPYLNDKPVHKVGAKVLAKRDTRNGVMCCEPAHIGRVGVVKNYAKVGKDVCYELDFDGRIDFADHCTLSGLDVV